MASRLKPCPNSPNCVCSRGNTEDSQHYIQPLKPRSSDGVMARLKQAVLAMPRTRLAEEEGDYMRVVFTSAFFRFKDDVEMEWDAEEGVVHIRSASRVGYSDLGANRKRVEAIRAALQ